MYTENPGRDLLICARAIASNQLAKFSPSLYVTINRDTGRGEVDEQPRQIAEYFMRCFCDYRDNLGMDEEQFDVYLDGKQVLEYGPGDILGVALLLYAHGAQRVCCVDRFPLSRMTDRNIAVYRILLDMLGVQAHARACSAFKDIDDLANGFVPDAIEYRVTDSGLAGSTGPFDLVVSRAVLEHVNSLEDTIFDIKHCLKRGGVSLHEVDLKSHGLDRYTEFDFLTWPDIVYRLMYAYKGFPNRWRIDKYKELVTKARLSLAQFRPTGKVAAHKIDVVYPKIAQKFAGISREDLSWTGFWMVLEQPE